MVSTCHSVLDKEAHRGHIVIEVAEPTGGNLILNTIRNGPLVL